MTQLYFPVLPSGDLSDSSKYSVEQLDNSMSVESDGGYIITRARNLRPPRKTWKIGYTNITDEDKKALERFYGETMGGSRSFEWIDPESKATFMVRFKGNISYSYVGRGPWKSWDCGIELHQV